MHISSFVSGSILVSSSACSINILIVDDSGPCNDHVQFFIGYSAPGYPSEVNRAYGSVRMKSGSQFDIVGISEESIAFDMPNIDGSKREEDFMFDLWFIRVYRDCFDLVG